MRLTAGDRPQGGLLPFGRELKVADGQAGTRLPASRLDWANGVKADECVQANAVNSEPVAAGGTLSAA